VLLQNLNAQIQLTPFVTGTAQGLDKNIQEMVENRLRGIISANGMNSGVNTAFVLAAKFNVIDKAIIPGPPKKVVTVLEFSLAIGNGKSNQCFGSCSFEIKGVGNTDQAAIISALKGVKTKNPKIAELVKTATERIVAYYEENGPKLISQANTLVTKQSYEEAIDILSQIPMECSHYATAVQTMNTAFQKHIDETGQKIFMEAKAMWATSQEEVNATKIVSMLAQIDPNAACYAEANKLVQTIGNRIQKLKDEALAYERKMEQMAMKNAADLEKARIKAARDVAVAYAENQPKVEYYLVW
jgi:hypothetical protein